MLLVIFCILSIIIFVIIPAIAIKRYYDPHKHFFFGNLFWLVISVLIWPLTAVMLASRHKDTKLTLLFWSALMVWLVVGGYWLVNNFSHYIEIQREYINTLGTGV